MILHLEHTELAIVVVTAGIYMWALVNTTKERSVIILIVQRHCVVYRSWYLYSMSLALTFASFNALRPPVISVPFANTSAILKPSTAGSATADSAGFLERTAS